MKRIALVLFSVWNLSVAQDLVITNARIIDGTGAIVDQGSVVIRDGRISEVIDGGTNAQGTRIDAQGMTVMPGLIDSHVHLTAYRSRAQSELPGLLQEYLEAGFTTVMSNGDHFPTILGVRQRIIDGEWRGPRLLAAGPIFTAPEGHPATTICRGDAVCRDMVAVEVDSEDVARAKVRELADSGVNGIKAVFDAGGAGNRAKLDERVLAAVADEAQRTGLPLFVHVVNMDDVKVAVELGANRLVHQPGRLSGPDDEFIRALRDRSVAVSTTVSVRNPDGTAELRALLSLRVGTVRRLWDGGVTVAFGTDRPTAPHESLRNETESLSRVLSAEEIISAITRNAAVYLGMIDEIGTLESGKLADIVIIDGDPLADIADLANIEVVIQGGRVVVDNR